MKSKLKIFLFWFVVIIVPGGSLLLISRLKRIRKILGRVREELNKRKF